MKVCFLAGTLGRGGAERQLVYMLRALQQSGVAARVLCLTNGEFFEQEIKDLGIQVDCVGASPNRIKRLYETIKNLMQQPADILQSVHFYTNIYVGLTGRALKIPSIGAIRSDLKSEVAAHGLLGKWQLTLPRQLITNTETARCRAILAGVAPERIALVRNAVEIGEPPPRFDRSGRSTALNILFVGRLVKLKRADLFVKAAAMLEQQLPAQTLNFRVVGDGALREELERMANDLKLKQNRVSFLGWQNKMSEIYRAADILALTSDYEGSPNVLLEAMAHAVPVIATKVGGVSEILNPARGFLIEPNDVASLAAALKKLILNDDLRRKSGAAGRRYVAENHSLAYLQNRLSSIYSNLLTQ